MSYLEVSLDPVLVYGLWYDDDALLHEEPKKHLAGRNLVKGGHHTHHWVLQEARNDAPDSAEQEPRWNLSTTVGVILKKIIFLCKLSKS